LTRRQRSTLQEIHATPAERAAREHAQRLVEAVTSDCPGTATAIVAGQRSPSASATQRTKALSWVVFDDEDVTYMPTHQLQHLLSAQSKSLNTAYILFYKQVYAD